MLDVGPRMCQGRRVNFSDLGLSPSLVRAVSDAGYTDPTPIQIEAIPPALAGRDLIGCARTGTGKTAAFALPILQRIDAMAGDEPKMRALILTPTRELAAQIEESFARYGKHLELWHAVIFGGVSQGPQEAELRRGIDILVATPGRLLDLMEQRIVSLADIQIFVLDEADRMLDMGFLPDVRRVVRVLPSKRQTLFFSATMPPEIRALADSLLTDPVQHRGVAGVLGGGEGRAAGVLRRQGGEAGPAAARAAGARGRAGAGVQPHQARGEPHRRAPAPRRGLGGGDPRQQVAGGAHARARRL
jgi:superfamily II DNA/RNA helicase